jgi:hypothetical protein
MIAHDVLSKADDEAVRKWLHSANLTVVVQSHGGESRVVLVGDRGAIAAVLTVATTKVGGFLAAVHDALAPGQGFAIVGAGASTTAPTKGTGTPPIPQPPTPGGHPPDPAIFVANAELHGQVSALVNVTAQQLGAANVRAER